ncbi:hypothetical protein [Litoribrevibacter albus]|uniref:Uncharacterized protein n=1 Tax=Litoribrevibacter albus TaxID=1473156 RepID=A0AA37SAU1_9GAMM|nr:hypothetical protein [Litoribrevibacter albus]GLQ31730.1 hypothetical protein GCM10007876_22090 [Litoribrevibacter albus]
MMLFLPSQDELDCINDEGLILGKIRFDSTKDEHTFHPANESTNLSDSEKARIAERLSGLDSGKYSMPTQDDD